MNQEEQFVLQEIQKISARLLGVSDMNDSEQILERVLALGEAVYKQKAEKAKNVASVPPAAPTYHKHRREVTEVPSELSSESQTALDSLRRLRMKLDAEATGEPLVEAPTTNEAKIAGLEKLLD